MTQNETYTEYMRQLKKQTEKKEQIANKAILIAAAVLFSFIGAMLLLNYFNVLHLS